MGGSVSWRAVAGSVAGTSHSRRGAPCQDYSLLELAGKANSILVAITADGAGSASHGRQGAELACRKIFERVQWWLNLYDNALDRIDATVISKWIEWTRKDIKAEATKFDVELRALACTALGIVANSSRAVCFQIGDGALILRTVDKPLHVVFWPETGEYANMTCFLTDTTAQLTLQVSVIEGEPVDVAILTDGLQRLALQFSTRTAHLPFFDPMFERLAAESVGRPLELEQHLLRLLDSPAVNERTDDDKTLILATRRPLAEKHILSITS